MLLSLSAFLAFSIFKYVIIKSGIFKEYNINNVNMFLLIFIRIVSEYSVCILKIYFFFIKKIQSAKLV